MQFESLKVFCDVVRYRSFSQAAQANHVSQSAASQIVLQLEKRLGVQLIDRSTRPLRVTSLGRTYYEGCKELVQRYLDLEDSLRQAQSEMDTTVEVAAIYSVGLSDMGKYVDRFMTEHPGVRVHIEYLHPNRVYEKVQEGTADFGLVSFPRKSRELSFLPWRDEEMILACSPRHPLAKCSSLRPVQLSGEKYISFERGLTIRKEIDRFLRKHGVAIETTLEFDNIDSIKKAIEEDLGIALLPQPTFRREVEAKTLIGIPLSGCRFVRPLGIVQRRAPKLGGMALKFRDLLRQTDSPGLNGHSGNSDPSRVPAPQRQSNGAAGIAKRIS